VSLDTIVNNNKNGELTRCMRTNCLADHREKKGDMKKEALCNDGFEMPTSEIAAFHLHRCSIITVFLCMRYCLHSCVILLSVCLSVCLSACLSDCSFCAFTLWAMLPDTK